MDGLRALAVVPVILFHAGFTAFRGGFVGVDVFFVISGYLITTILANEMDGGSFSVLSFYERRARRILPALFVVLLCSIPPACAWLMPREMQAFARSLVAVVMFSSNFLFWTESGYFGANAELKPLLHTWSLAVEEQYYILFPLVLRLAWKLKRRSLCGLLVALSLCSLAFAQWASGHRPELGFYLLPARSWELLLGALVAVELRRETRRALPAWLQGLLGLAGLGCIAFAIVAFDEATPFPSVYALVPTLGCGLVLLYGQRGTLAGRILASRPLVSIGLLSYSLYLWHQPLLAFGKYRSVAPPSTALLSALCVATLPLAYLTWRYVETPFRTKGLLPRAFVFKAAAVATALFATVGLIISWKKGLPQRLPPRVVELAAAWRDINPRRVECASGEERYMAPRDGCVLGEPRRIVGALLGDSHADALAYALSRHLAEKGIGLRQAWFSSCPPIPGLYRTTGLASQRCAEFNDEALNMVLSDASLENVVLAARFTLYLEGTFFDNGEGGLERGPSAAMDVSTARAGSEGERKQRVARRYTEGIKALLDGGKRVVLVYPIPEVGWNVPALLAKIAAYEPDRSSPVSTSYELFKRRNQLTIAAFDALGFDDPELRRIYPHEELCDRSLPGRCVVVRGADVLYVDDDHLSNKGAEPFARAIVEHLRTGEQGHAP